MIFPNAQKTSIQHVINGRLPSACGSEEAPFAAVALVLPEVGQAISLRDILSEHAFDVGLSPNHLDEPIPDHVVVLEDWR